MSSAPAGTENPSVEELVALGRWGCVALAARAALRVFPLVADRRTLTRWGDQMPVHFESTLRGIQIALAAASTADDTLANAASEPVAAAVAANDRDVAAASYAAVAAARSEARGTTDGGAPGYVRLAQQALEAAEAIASLQATAHDTASGPLSGWIRAATLDDVASLRGVASNTSPVPPEFFTRPLWRENQPPATWGEMRSRYWRAFEGTPVASLARTIESWERGEFDPTALEREVNDWLLRHPPPPVADPQVVHAPASSTAAATTGSPFANVTPLPTAPRGQYNRALDPAPASTSSPPPAVAPRIAPPPPFESQTIIGPDGRARVDTLGRTKLARVLADFIADQRTGTPLTLSIEGRWGGGKTTFMGLLKAELQKLAGSEGRVRIRSVDFNPWRSQSHEELWAAFALEVLRQLRADLPWWQRLRAQLCFEWKVLKRFSAFLGALRVALSLFAVAAVGLLVWELAAYGWDWTRLRTEAGDPASWWELLGWQATAAPVLFLVGRAIWGMWRNSGGLLTWQLKNHLKRPDYAAQTSFLEEFHRDFPKVIEAYVGRNERVVAFIDDLDRCDVPMAADLMRGLNLMIGEDAPIVFILGLDRTKVAAGLAVKHADLLPFLYVQHLTGVVGDQAEAALRSYGLEYGYEFIEKFVQLPFRLPPPTPAELVVYVQKKLHRPSSESPPGKFGADAERTPSIRPGAPSEKPTAPAPAGELSAPPPAPAGPASTASLPGRAPATPPPPPAVAAEPPPPPVADESGLEQPLLHASQILDGNPRRINQLINLVRLQRRLAKAQNLELSDGQIAKWTAISLRWPRFILELSEMEPWDRKELLGDLLSDAQPHEPSAAYLRWNEERRLVDFLREWAPNRPADPRGQGLSANLSFSNREAFHTARRLRGETSYDLTDPGVLESLLRLAIAIPVAETTMAAATAADAAAATTPAQPAAVKAPGVAANTSPA